MAAADHAIGDQRGQQGFDSGQESDHEGRRQQLQQPGDRDFRYGGYWQTIGAPSEASGYRGSRKGEADRRGQTGPSPDEQPRPQGRENSPHQPTETTTHPQPQGGNGERRQSG